ncbi:MAG TPA: hypothetical protein VKB41_10760 [Steroidobacteraceae bacterium]|jgi:hypothetical protein|nr:hypothetical protein [Steroidobacteraceae bacterium]
MKISVPILTTAIVSSLAGGLVTASLLLGNAAAADKEPAAPPAILTIYISEHGSSVKEMNQAHSKYFAEGYRFAAMTAHNENGDHKGVWITYVRSQ